MVDDDSDKTAHRDETPVCPDRPPDSGNADDAFGCAQLESDFARYFLSLPEAPPDVDRAPEETFEDLVLEAETIHGADRVAARARREDPGPATALMLDAIARRRLSATGLLDAACAAERLASWTQAVQHRYLAAFSRPGVCASTEDLAEYVSAPGQPLHQQATAPANTPSDSANSPGPSAADGDLGCSGSRAHGDPATNDALCLAAFKVAAAEVSAALRVSPISANRRVSQAVDFADELPATLTALRRGVIDRGRSLVIADRTQNLPTDLRLRVEAIVVPKAATRNAGQLRGIVDRAVIAADPAAAKKRQEAARRNRGVSLRANEDGMSVFRADLPADKACTAFTVIDQIALIGSRRADENRTINALRADAFADIFDQLADHGSVHLHTILGKGHTNIDPRQPCPNHAEPAARSAAGTGPSTSGPTTGGSGAGAADEVGRDRTSGIPEGASDSDAGKPRNSADMTCSADHSSTSASGFDDDNEADACGTNDHATNDGQANDGGTNDVDSACDSVHGNAALDTHGSECAECANGDQYTDRAVHLHDADQIHDVRDGSAGLRPEDLQSHGARPVAGAETERPRHRLAAPVLATHAAEHVPTTAATDCGCHEPNIAPATPPVWGLGTHQGRATGLNVTIAATTLAGLDDLPGELDGHGTIPADLARALAASAATVTAIAVNPACGTALDLGRTVYRPRQAQRDYVNQRDQTCRFPSCRQPAWRCQLDHSDEFCPGKQDSGVTCPCNLACLCKFHHDLKTFGLWDTEHHTDDSITFTSPTGRTYTTRTREWLTGLTESPVVRTTFATADTGPEIGDAADAIDDIASPGPEDSGNDDPPPF